MLFEIRVADGKNSQQCGGAAKKAEFHLSERT
jgi:hypothetical protein